MAYEWSLEELTLLSFTLHALTLYFYLRRLLVSTGPLGLHLRRFGLLERALDQENVLEDRFRQLLLFVIHLELKQAVGTIVQIIDRFLNLLAQRVALHTAAAFGVKRSVSQAHRLRLQALPFDLLELQRALGFAQLHVGSLGLVA